MWIEALACARIIEDHITKDNEGLYVEPGEAILVVVDHESTPKAMAEDPLGQDYDIRAYIRHGNTFTIDDQHVEVDAPDLARMSNMMLVYVKGFHKIYAVTSSNHKIQMYAFRSYSEVLASSPVADAVNKLYDSTKVTLAKFEMLLGPPPYIVKKRQVVSDPNPLPSDAEFVHACQVHKYIPVIACENNTRSRVAVMEIKL